jgi:hypothetical protein
VTGTLDGPRAKIQRAEKHIHCLQGEITRFHESDPYGVSVGVEAESGDRVWSVTKMTPPPQEFALVAGDAIHNLRSALDLVFCQLVIANGKQVDGRDSYPVCASPKEFGVAADQLGRKKRVSADALAAIRSTRPHKAGNDAIWRLHRLDIADKHRELFIVGAAFRSFHLPALKIPGFPERHLPLMAKALSQAAFRPADRHFPLKVGDSLFRVPADLENYNPPKFNFEVAFGQGEIVEGVSVLECLGNLRSETEKVVEHFEQLVCPGASPSGRRGTD